MILSLLKHAFFGLKPHDLFAIGYPNGAEWKEIAIRTSPTEVTTFNGRLFSKSFAMYPGGDYGSATHMYFYLYEIKNQKYILVEDGNWNGLVIDKFDDLAQLVTRIVNEKDEDLGRRRKALKALLTPEMLENGIQKATKVTHIE